MRFNQIKAWYWAIKSREESIERVIKTRDKEVGASQPTRQVPWLLALSSPGMHERGLEGNDSFNWIWCTAFNSYKITAFMEMVTFILAFLFYSSPMTDPHTMYDWGAALWLIALWLIEVQIGTEPISPGSQTTAPMNIIHPEKTPLFKLELLSSNFTGRVGHLAKLVCLWCSLEESARLISFRGFRRQKSSLQLCSCAILFGK